MKITPYLLLSLLWGQILFANQDPNEHTINSDISSKWILNDTRYDAGKVKQLDEVVHEFIFYNSLEVPVNISNSAPSCSCLINPAIFNQEVLPQERFVLRLKLDTVNGGLKESYIDFNILPIQEKFTLHMRCEVKQTLTVVPEMINFGNHLEGESPVLSRKLNIINSDDSIANLELEFHGPKNDYLIVKQNGETKQLILENNEKYYVSKFDIDCAISHLLPGDYNGMIEIQESHSKENLLIQIPYSLI